MPKDRLHTGLCAALAISILTVPLAERGSADGFRLPFSKPKSSLVRVSERIDALEQKLHKDGTVVVKAPDVWGQSRLTKHRQEFERILSAKQDDFELLLNGSIRRSDQAYLANALAIQAALTSGVAPPDVAGQAPSQTDLNLVNNLTTGTIAGAASDNPPIVRTDIRELDAGDPRFKFFGFQDSAGIALEPTIQLDQLKRYLDHLHEIRRVNEGDDTADAPGYSLNLVRVPVSILPGEKTRQGHAAEIEITAVPHVTTELLPRVFRQLVINDLVDALGVPVLRAADVVNMYAVGEENTCDELAELSPNWTALNERQRLRLVTGFDVADPEPGASDLPDATAPPRTESPAGGGAEDRPESVDEEVLNAYRQYRQGPVPPFESNPPAPPDTPNGAPPRIDGAIPPANQRASVPPMSAQALRKSYQRTMAQSFTLATTGASFRTAGLRRNSRQPVPAIQSTSVFGRTNVVLLAYEYWKQRPEHVRSHLPDAMGFLKEQLEAGYDYLLTPQGIVHWEMIPQIHEAIRTDDVKYLSSLRSCVVRDYHIQIDGEWVCISGVPSPVTACAWWILVESALLNHQLNEDMQRVSQDPDCYCLNGVWHSFYGADPPMEARQAFVDYVNCRWPIHVFALDPVVQQQNIADTFSMRREMQLALALAFAAGRINAQNMTRFARRLELDMETVALNRTDVAFGHGADTFGWRFYPRVQTPPFESNFTAGFRDLLMGGPNKDQLQKHWEIEPGMRECVAIVVMPSFIEHVTFHARGNYFRMSDVTKIRSTMSDNAAWSEGIREMDMLITQVCAEADRYLPGEVERLQARVAQLSRKLPMQTVHSRVPNENTLGGFEMFSSGVTDLAPELLDYFGQPGVDTRTDTILYLVGNHFSVHETRVLAGNRECDFELISRQVMLVRIPAGVQAMDARVSGCVRPVVDVHIATPYGVSRHLPIPVINAACDSAGYVWARREVPVLYRYRFDGKANSGSRYSIADVDILTPQPQELGIDVPPYEVLANEIALDVQVTLSSHRATLLIASFSSQASGANGTIFSKVPYDGARRQYVLRGAGYGDFHRAVRNGVDSLLENDYADGPPNGVIDLEIRATIEGDSRAPINGVVHMPIKLQTLP